VGDEMQKNIPVRRVVDAGSHFALLILTGASLILSTVIIFFIQRPQLQIRLCITGILLSVLIIVFYISEMRKLSHTTLALLLYFLLRSW
jgi:FtsH-binding integral membrane protein